MDLIESQIESQRKKFCILLWFTVLAVNQYHKETPKQQILSLYSRDNESIILERSPDMVIFQIIPAVTCGYSKWKSQT